jgi:hypothetical protein
MVLDEGVTAGIAALGTMIGAAAGALGMKRRSDSQKSDLRDDIRVLSERLIRLEVQLEALRAERAHEREVYDKLISRIEVLANSFARIEAVCKMQHGIDSGSSQHTPR